MKTCSGLWSVLLNCALCELKPVWVLPARVRNRRGVVFDLVACPFGFCSHVWRHAATTQTRLYAESSVVTRSVAKEPFGAGRGGAGRMWRLYFRCEETVVPCGKPV